MCPRFARKLQIWRCCMNEKRLFLSHVLAAAGKQLFRGALLGGGGTTDVGFYYDFHLPHTADAVELQALEQKMRELLDNGALRQDPAHRAEIRRRLEEAGEGFRVEALDALPDEPADERQNLWLVEGPDIVDFSRSQLPTGSDLALKLETVSGAYWMGDESRPMLTRIGGIAFESAGALSAFEEAREETASRDHRQLGRRLGLFTVAEEVGKGLPMLLPGGAAIRRELERFIIDEELTRGYEQVYTPVLGRKELYETSGHLAHYRESMYPPVTVDGEQYILRPMTCPHHFMLYKSSPRSHRELPIRYTEISPLYRKERSGELYGLVRIMSFHLADSHIMCRADQVEREFLQVLDLVQFVMRTLGLEEDCTYRASLGSPDEEKLAGRGWREAERLLLAAVETAGLQCDTAPGEAAFYGPKLDVQMRNIHGKEETVFTIQIDMVLPERFEMDYQDSGGVRRRPVVIHRSSVGCIKRSMAFLIEKYAGALPLWIAPVQLRLLPVNDAVTAYAKEVMSRLRRLRLRIDTDNRSGPLGRRLHAAREKLVPYIGIVGPKEADGATVSILNRDTGRQTEYSLEELALRLSGERNRRSLELGL